MYVTKALAFCRTAQPLETEEQETARFKRLYLKAPEKKDPEGEQALAQFYEALIRRYTAGIAADSAVPGALQGNLRGDLLTIAGTAALGLARATLTALAQSSGLAAALDQTREALVCRPAGCPISWGGTMRISEAISPLPPAPTTAAMYFSASEGRTPATAAPPSTGGC